MLAMSSSGISLRYYQAAALKAVSGALDAGARTLSLHIAVGAGKSMVAAHLVRELVLSGRARSLLFLVDRVEMQYQIAEVLGQVEMPDGAPLPTAIRVGQDATGLVTPVVNVATTRRADAALKADPDFLARHDAVIVDCLSVPISLLQGFSGIAVVFLPSPRLSVWGELVYEYSAETALRDGVLVDVSFPPHRPTQAQRPGLARSVFLSNAEEENQQAELFALALSAAGYQVHRAAEPGPLHSGDALVILLSSNNTGLEEASVALLRRRSVDVIPVLVRPAAVPRHLSVLGVVDGGHGPDPLLDLLGLSTRIDLNRLSPASFEDLVSKLLARLDFQDVVRAEHAPDSGADMTASYVDALGFAEPVLYAVQSKFGSPTAQQLRAFAGSVEASHVFSRGLLVTNGQLTTVAASRLDEINERRGLLRVVDGPELRTLLLRFPDLIAEFF